MQHATLKGLLIIAAATFGQAYGMGQPERITTPKGLTFLDTKEVYSARETETEATYLEFQHTADDVFRCTATTYPLAPAANPTTTVYTLPAHGPARIRAIGQIMEYYAGMRRNPVLYNKDIQLIEKR
jgi:hypothetical protein